MASNNIKKDHVTDWFNYIAFDLWHEIGDPEAEKYFWLKGPWLTWLATIGYMYIVMKAGPDFMRNRKPYDLKLAIRLYNLLLVVINTYLFIGTVRSFRYGLDFWGCGEPISTRKREIMLHYGHLFFHTRYLEFFDTFFFVLRKKNSQISFLHVFHHAIVPTLMYIGLKFYPLPFNSLLPSTNMFVHIIMYAYYGLATFGPEVQRYLWWKKYLTTMQISQFVLLIIHCAHAFILSKTRSDCQYPLTMVVINFFIGLTFLTLFVSFYRQTYKNSQRTSIRSAKQQMDANTKSSINGVKSPAGIGPGSDYANNSISDGDLLIKQKYS
uniref:Elongation of very long chain fatty acids protein n=1 Tax=Aceria tosichella TaxID=561515 RepID=A0A6G1SNM1_9ACAR